MWNWYKFETDGQKIIKIELRCSFSPDMHFVVCEDDNKYTAYWRTELSNAEYFDKFLAELHNKINHFMPLEELSETTEYKEILNKYSPVYSAVLNESQKNTIDKFLKNGIDENVHEPHGRDGHSYFIEVYSPEFKKYHCWCILPEEWSILADVLNMLAIDIAGLDCQRYGCRTGGKL
ncbi:MAG: hypothetical protein NC177_01000 [Ruminococcus flavefaciens]|nr:hypothetical protein [Ruminococcus flavefaciens]